MITPSVFLTAAVFGLGGYAIGVAEAYGMVRRGIKPLRKINEKLIKKMEGMSSDMGSLAGALLISSALIRACRGVYRPAAGISTRDLCAVHLLLEQGDIIAQLSANTLGKLGAPGCSAQDVEKRADLMVREAKEKSAKIVK